MHRKLQNFGFKVSCTADSRWRRLQRNCDGNIKALRDISQFKHDQPYLTAPSKEISQWASGGKVTTEHQ
jgi:hypothetical protein